MFVAYDGVSLVWEDTSWGQIAHQEEPAEHDSGHAKEVDQNVVLYEVRSRDSW